MQNKYEQVNSLPLMILIWDFYILSYLVYFYFNTTQQDYTCFEYLRNVCRPTNNLINIKMWRDISKIELQNWRRPIFFILIIKQYTCSDGSQSDYSNPHIYLEIPTENKCFSHITMCWSSLKTVQFKFTAVNRTAGDQVFSTQTQIWLRGK